MAPMLFGGYRLSVSGRLILSLLGLAAAGLVALALVWPQGSGRPSPAPFGHPMAPAAKVN